MINETLSQIKLVEIEPGLLRVHVRQNQFTAGEISNGIFYSAPRSVKNLFKLFGEPRLGINEEILLRTDFSKIKVKFNDKILTTTRLKWLNLGIVSPYCNQSVDKQILMKLTDIDLDEVEKWEPEEKQVELFAEVM